MADDFSNVSWQNDPRSGISRTNSSRSVEERNGVGGSSSNGMRQDGNSNAPHPEGIDDPLDLAGVGGGTLECTVSSPIKENEGTKDVFVSYLVTTHVCVSGPAPITANRIADHVSFIRKADDDCEAEIHRFRLFV